MTKREKVMTEKTLIKTFLYVWPYVIVVAGLVYLIGHLVGTEEAWIWTLSFFLGSAVSVMLMSHHYRTSMKTAATSPEDLKKVAIRNYIFRFAFYALILFVAHLSDGLDLIFTFVGFMSFKVAMFLTFLLSKREVSEGNTGPFDVEKDEEESTESAPRKEGCDD